VNSRLQEIARRKQILIDQAARERYELGKVYNSLRLPFGMSAPLLGIVRVLKTHPLITAGLSSVLVGGYASRLLRSVTEFFKLWRIVLPIWAWWSKRDKAKIAREESKQFKPFQMFKSFQWFK
jgi:hypothetical protein